MKSRVIALMLAGAVAVSGCAPESGVVKGKRYEKGYMTTTSSCMWVNNNCSYVSVPMWVPESYVLLLRDGDDEGDRDVPQIAWVRCPVGARYPECAETT